MNHNTKKQLNDIWNELGSIQTRLISVGTSMDASVDGWRRAFRIMEAADGIDGIKTKVMDALAMSDALAH